MVARRLNWRNSLTSTRSEGPISRRKLVARACTRHESSRIRVVLQGWPPDLQTATRTLRVRVGYLSGTMRRFGTRLHGGDLASGAPRIAVYPLLKIRRCRVCGCDEGGGASWPGLPPAWGRRAPSAARRRRPESGVSSTGARRSWPSDFRATSRPLHARRGAGDRRGRSPFSLGDFGTGTVDEPASARRGGTGDNATAPGASRSSRIGSTLPVVPGRRGRSSA